MNSFQIKFGLGIVFLSLVTNLAYSQSSDSRQKPLIRHFDGNISATNNGISIIPSFSLGRPAVFFDLSAGGERLSFDPMFRFGMNGKPWSFVFWWRYKILKDQRFTLTAGAHPAFIFQDKEVIVDGKPEIMFIANRYLAGEINQLYKFSDKFSMGLYYLHGNGFNPTGPKLTDFLALNMLVSNLRIVKDFTLKMNPQLYFLSVDKTSGYYVSSNFTLSKGDFPISFQSLVNQKIDSTVPGEDLVWNVSLVYNFSNQYSKR